MRFNIFQTRADRIAIERGYQSFATRNVTASGKRLDLTDTKALESSRKKKTAEWQERSWRYYDEIGEVWFGHNYIANAMRKMILYPARVESPDEAPVPLEEGDRGYAESVELLERMAGDDGTHGDFLRDLSLNLSVVGDSLVVVRNVDRMDETWSAHSRDELFVNDKGRWAIRESPSDRKGEELDASPVENGGDIVVRIWRSHPRWKAQADSAMKAVLDPCEELQILSREIKATALSRLSAGVQYVPSEMLIESPTNTSSESNDGKEHKLITDLIEGWITPVEDPASAASVAPTIIKIPLKFIEAMVNGHQTFSRPTDATTAAQRVELIQRIANGLDMPAELLLGKGGLNHWTSWQVDEDTFKAHVEPPTLLIVSALTKHIARPLLGEAAEDAVVWYNPAQVVSHPNRGKDADEAFDRMAISYDAYRRYKHFSDSDAPTEEEKQERIEIKRLERTRAVAPGESSGVDAEDVEAGPPGATVVAAAPLPFALNLDRVSRRLADTDARLQERLEDLVNSIADKALEKAGAYIRRNADASLRKMLNGIPNAKVLSSIGANTMRTFNVEQIITDEVANVEGRYDTWVRAGQDDLLDVLDDLNHLSPEELRVAEERMDEDRRQGWLLLAAGVGGLLMDRALGGERRGQGLGEFDEDILVPRGMVRGSLARAGGSSIEDAALDHPSGGVTTGHTAMDLFAQSGLHVADWEWVYGSRFTRKKPFVAHESLNGYRFSDWDDPFLAVQGGDEWIGSAYYFPGDHLYCQCTFIPFLAFPSTDS